MTDQTQTSTTVVRLTPDASGCWIDGSWGIYGVPQMIIIAEANGYQLSDHDRLILEAYTYGIESIKLLTETVNAGEAILMQGGIGDQVEEWLNEHIAPYGHRFGWREGEFFLMPMEWWKED